jgi:hypothetical protein
VFQPRLRLEASSSSRLVLVLPRANLDAQSFDAGKMAPDAAGPSTPE